MWLLECCCVRVSLEGIKRIPIWRTLCAWPKALCSSPAHLLKPAVLHCGQRLCAPQQEASLPTLGYESGLCSAASSPWPWSGRPLPPHPYSECFGWGRADSCINVVLSSMGLFLALISGRFRLSFRHQLLPTREMNGKG